MLFRSGLQIERRFTLFVGSGVAAKVRFYQPLNSPGVSGLNPMPEAPWTIHVVPHLFAGVQL